ncbi:hypothetical protein [Methanofollis ethanolicus]|uniref:hypothetical protein n=1 Tax=Methanofollis ethanolicus TaxID=488124 RepID=UPI0013663B3D|nr:hypothetical protein [Methanofollis ethanolicus]
MVADDDDVGPPEPADSDDGVREICLRVFAEEDDGTVGDAAVPDEAETAEDGVGKSRHFSEGAPQVFPATVMPEKKENNASGKPEEM